MDHKVLRGLCTDQSAQGSLKLLIEVNKLLPGRESTYWVGNEGTDMINDIISTELIESDMRISREQLRR